MFELKKSLMAGVALGALLAPVTASAQGVSTEMFASWDNDVDVSMSYDLTVTKDFSIVGNVTISGTVESNALAQANLDDKQILHQNEVEFEDYQNVNTPPDVFAEPIPGDTANGAHPATYTNTVTAGNDTASGASGNIGLNMAAGDYNLQENAAVIANADPFIGVNGNQQPSGGAEASSFSLQNLFDNGFNENTSTGNISNSYELENTVIRNSASLGTGTLAGATGNIGVNAAAGAFNIQKNALVIASVTGGNLAEANAAVMQDARWNDSVVEDVANSVTIGTTLMNASGNIGVNLASGVGNMQINTLTIASAVSPTGAPTPTPTPVSTGTGTGTGGGGGGG